MPRRARKQPNGTEEPTLTGQTADEASEQSPPQEPDIFDEAIAARQAEAAAQLNPLAQHPASSAAPESATQNRGPTAEPDRPQQSDGTPKQWASKIEEVWTPAGFAVAEPADRKHPWIHFGENRKFKQAVIKFDEKPSEAHLERIKQEGGRWRHKEALWSFQLDKDDPGSTRERIINLALDIGNAIRAENGLPPKDLHTWKRSVENASDQSQERGR